VKRSSVAIVILAIALIGSNAFWAYRTLDNGISLTHLEVSYQEARAIALQAMAVIPAAASLGATREGIIAAAQRADRHQLEPFEKDGFLWVGDIGLQFDTTGRLVKVASASDPF
jgi:hypothetical protein